MSKLLFIVFAAMILLNIQIKAQSVFTVDIVSDGPTTICGNDSVNLMSSLASNSWTQKADFGGGQREFGVGFSIGNKGYIGLGTGSSLSYTEDFWEYDPATDTWTQKANYLGGTRVRSSAFSIGNKGYVGLGANNTGFFNDFYEYDPVTNIWTQIADFGGGARYDATGFCVGSKGYIATGAISGSGPSGFHNDLWEYNPATNTWIQKADFPGSVRSSASSFGIGNKGYVGLGCGMLCDNFFWEYDPAINNWTQKASFPGGQRMWAVGLSIGCKGYIGTGMNVTDFDDFWEYDPVADNWTQRPNVGGGIREHGVGFSINGKGYISTGDFKSDLWEYTPVLTYSWSTGVTTNTMTAPMTGVYSLTVASIACYTATASQSVSINPTPTVSVNSASLCSGTNVVLMASVNPSVGTIYSWSPASSSNSSISVSPTSNTVYTVIATNAGCSESAVSSVTVFPSSTAVTDFSYVSPVCMTGSDPLPGLATGFSANGSFTSAPGLSLDANIGLIDLNTSTAGTYVVTYSVATNDCIFANSSSTSVVVADPTAAVTDFSYPTPICLHDNDPFPSFGSNFTNGGDFSGTNGLSIEAVTGQIDLSNSTPGIYTITYSVNASNSNCVMAATNSVSISIGQNPTLTINSVSTINFGDHADLIALSSAGTYTWFPPVNLSCILCADPIASPLETTTYCVKTSDGTCTNSVCVTVKVKLPCSDISEMALPNAFSPNGDGSNDQFCMQGESSCIKNFVMMIYDRWGEKVFETSNPDFCWDGSYKGQTLDPDVFVYYVKALYNNDKDFIKKGNITLIR